MRSPTPSVTVVASLGDRLPVTIIEEKLPFPFLHLLREGLTRFVSFAACFAIVDEPKRIPGRRNGKRRRLRQFLSRLAQGIINRMLAHAPEPVRSVRKVGFSS